MEPPSKFFADSSDEKSSVSTIAMSDIEIEPNRVNLSGDLSDEESSASTAGLSDEEPTTEPPLKLLDDSSDEPISGFTINTGYAQNYDVWRNNEEMQKLKDLTDDSSESESEEEPEIEKDFLKTLSLLKSKDPRIYSENTKFFENEAVPIKKSKEKKEKPMSIKEFERKTALVEDGDSIDEDEENNQLLRQRSLLTYKEEEDIKKSFQAAAPDSDEDDLFEVRTKTEAEEKKEEADYKQWLETEKDLQYLKKHWEDPGLGEDDKFLRDYLLNKRFIADDKPGEIPMYDEITQDIDLLKEDERELERQEMFEHKYNFRFEDPDEQYIKSFPRTIGDSLRRENNKRKQKREEYAERKKREKEQKKEELKRLKALKRKEIEEKFLKLKEASGQDELNIDESDMESDFDPDKHDRKMREMFNDEYYNVEEEQKPEFEFEPEIDDENWDRWTRDQTNPSQNTMHENDEDEEGSSDEEDEDNPKSDLKSDFMQEMIDSTASRKKRGRKKSLFGQILSQPKPLYDPSGKSFEDYLDEYYKLDYEDIIGDLPVRFKYRKVVPNDFGLTVDEILAAQDKELNRWCSVKKTCQYRDDRDEIYDVQAFQKKAQNFDMKKKILTSVYAPPEEEKPVQANTDNSNEAAAKPKKRRKRGKKKKKTEESNAAKADINPAQNSGLSSNNAETNSSQESSTEVPPEEEKANTDNSNEVVEKRKKRRRKRGKGKKKKKTEESNAAEADINPAQNDGLPIDLENTQTENNQILVNGEKNKLRSLEKNDAVQNIDSFIGSDEINESNTNSSPEKRKRKKLRTMEEKNSSLVEPQSEHQIRENEISKKRKRNHGSLEKGPSTSFAEYNKDDDDDEAEAKNSQNVMKKKKPNSYDETDSSSVKQMRNRNGESANSSFSQQNTRKSIYAENAAKNYSNRKKKQRNNQQSFSSRQPWKNRHEKNQFSSNVVEIVDSSGKMYAPSSSRLSAFEINPKKFQHKLKYGKKQT